MGTGSESVIPNASKIADFARTKNTYFFMQGWDFPKGIQNFLIWIIPF